MTNKDLLTDLKMMWHWWHTHIFSARVMGIPDIEYGFSNHNIKIIKVGIGPDIWQISKHFPHYLIVNLWVGIRALRRHCGKCALRMAFAHGLKNWLPCAHTHSDGVQNLHVSIKLCYLHLLFSWSLSQITPYMRNQPYMHVLGFCAWVQALIKFKICMQL